MMIDFFNKPRTIKDAINHGITRDMVYNNVKRGLLGGIIAGASVVSIGLVLTKPEVSSFISSSVSSSSTAAPPSRSVNFHV
jgi:hypothetical protein